jgi:predicted MFS family arabinose efflux permease
MGRATYILVLLCLTYIFSQFFRNSTGVIGPELMTDFGFGPGGLGLLSAAYFLGISLAQIPTGLLLDRIGPRYTIYGLMGFTVLGTLVFALAPGFSSLVTGRIIMGIGCGAAYIGATVVCARWFPPDRFAGASSIVLASGNLGAVLATTPLAWSAAAFGWRETFLAAAALTFTGCLWAYTVVRDAPPGHAFLSRRKESIGETLNGLWQVMTNREFLRVLGVAFTNYPLVVVILGLWGAPYLFDLHGLSPVDRGNILLAMALSTIAGFLIYGQLDRLLDTRKWLVIGGLGMSVLILLVLGLAGPLPVGATTALFSALGLFGSFNSVTLAHGRALFAPNLVGRMAAMFNLAVQGGVGLIQFASGLLVAAFVVSEGTIPVLAYRVLFLALAAVGLLALLFYAPLADAKPSRDRRG